MRLYTLLFVMLAEVLIFVQSIAFFRLNWLLDRLSLAQVAALVVEAAPDGRLPDMLRDDLLQSADVRAITLRRPDARRVILMTPMETPVAATYDLTGDGRTTAIRRSPWHWVKLIGDAVMVFATDPHSFIRVIGKPGTGTDEQIEVVMPVAPLRTAMLAHALNILVLSIAISLATALAVYYTLDRLLVVPMMRLTESMMHFSANPEDTTRIVLTSGRNDEIGVAETELAHMQTELHNTLAQKSRLAALGLAVSKINHDLRNMLASTQLMSDRLTTFPDPQVRSLAPKLVASLDRAINFCNSTLQFGRAAEPPPNPERFELAELAADVAESLACRAPTSAGAPTSTPHSRSMPTAISCSACSLRISPATPSTPSRPTPAPAAVRRRQRSP